jgi:hypothetical protein
MLAIRLFDPIPCPLDNGHNGDHGTSTRQLQYVFDEASAGDPVLATERLQSLEGIGE